MLLVQGIKLDEDIRIWLLHTHEIHVNHHHYHSQTLLTSALIYCDDYGKKVMNSMDLLLLLISLNRSLIYSNVISLNDELSRFLLNKNDSEMEFINYYPLIKTVKMPLD